jgi:hypothetical protein
MNDRIPRWVAAVVLVGAALAVAGAVLSEVAPTTLVPHGEPMTAAAWRFADYTFARDLALGLGLLVALAARARQALAGLMVLTAAVQLVDAVQDAIRGDWVLVPGLVIFAALFLVGAVRLRRQNSVSSSRSMPRRAS